MISKTQTKYIQSLQHKKLRDELNQFIAEGPKVVADLLDTGAFVCTEVFALQEWLEANETLGRKYDAVVFNAIKDFELEKISALSTPNQVLAIFKKRNPISGFETAGKITLALDTVQDPGNMGTIIRIADWFGIENIVCTEGSADIYNLKVVQSTMGSLGRVNVLYTNLPLWIAAQKKVKTYAASLQGKPIQSVGKLSAGIIIIGNEAHGISDELMQLANEKITIPKTGQAESLNAAVATGIILSHLL
jgi:RNA methyltransferase, TrmH family